MAFGVPEKKAWLAGICAEYLREHTSVMQEVWPGQPVGLNVETRYRRVLDYASSRQERVDVMGDPCWYLVVMETGPTRSTHERSDLGYRGGIHTFELVLNLQYKDHDDPDQASQAVFDQMTEGWDMPWGLLMQLRRVGYVSHEGCTLQIASVYDDQKTIVSLDSDNEDAAHMLYCKVEVDDGAN